MTCIVGMVDGSTVWLAGDRAATDGQLNRTILKHPKIFVKGDVAFGIAGLPKFIDVLQHSTELPLFPGGDDKKFIVSELIPCIRESFTKHECVAMDQHGQKLFMGSMLVAFAGKLYKLDSSFQTVEADCGFDAVGNGAPMAKGALASLVNGNDQDPRHILLEALNITATSNAGVAPPFDIIHVKSRW